MSSQRYGSTWTKGPPTRSTDQGQHKKVTVTVQLRKTGRQGHRKFNLGTKCPTIAAVKALVIKELQPSWTTKDVTLNSSNIVIFRRCGMESTNFRFEQVTDEITALIPTEYEMNNSSIFLAAMEYFTTVPVDLLRTVENSMADFAVLTHPDHVNRQWTSVSPLTCAAFQEVRRKPYKVPESKFPWFHTSQDDGDPEEHGVSSIKIFISYGF